jgi:hypothetical protein
MRSGQRHWRAHRLRAPAPTRGVTLLVLTAAVACNNLLDVQVPSRIPADQLEVPGNAQLLVNGAVSDFDCALGSYVVMAGLMTDELEDATLTAARWVYDQRSIQSNDQIYAVNGCEALGTYTPLNRARESADNVLRLLNRWTDAQVPSTVNRTALIATMAAYAGYARLLLGEMFCSAVISTIDENHNLIYGTELTPQQMFQSADSMFTTAIAAAQTAHVDSSLKLAYVGRARTRLDLGQQAAAKADAQQVTDPSFVYYATASTTTPRRTNRVYVESNKASGRSSSVAPQYQNVTYRGKPDPRVPVDTTPDVSTTGVHIWAQTKYTSGASPIPVASYGEAQLIVAEGDVAAGDLNGAVAIINALHARVGLDAYNGPVTATDVLNQVIEERRRELFLQGQRLGDVRRYNLSILPAPGTPYRNGGVYGPVGSKLCLPLPDAERQANPKLRP